MGVPGLTTFISKRSNQYLERCELQNCYLVLDGNNIASHLYDWVAKCNCAFGGDYDKYAQCVTVFFNNLKQCNIIPLVLFDGGYETRKLRTVHKRLTDKISLAKRINPFTNSKHRFFPLFMKEVFKDIMRQMEISFAQCDFEADDEIAAVARHLGCPVLSYDSDFYVYDVLYIPFSTLELEVTRCFLEESSNSFMGCKIYNVNKFLQKFGGLEKSLLPLMATLLGNDYIPKSTFKKFFSLLKLPKNCNMSHTQRQIAGVIKWLTNESLESAVKKILYHLKAEERHYVEAQIRRTIAGYTTCSNKMLTYLGMSLRSCSNAIDLHDYFKKYKNISTSFKCDIKEDNPHSSGIEQCNVYSSSEEEGELDEDLINKCNKPHFEHDRSTLTKIAPLPVWFMESFRQGRFPASFMDMLVLHTYFCTPQVDNNALSHSHTITMPIVQVIFGLLTAEHSTEGLLLKYTARNAKGKIECFPLPPIYGNEIIKKFPPLEMLPKLSDNIRTSLLYETMGLSVSDINILNEYPSDWKVFIVGLLYWVKHVTKPVISYCHIYAVLLGLVALKVIDEKVGYLRTRRKMLMKYGKIHKHMEKSKQLKTPKKGIGNSRVGHETHESGISDNKSEIFKEQSVSKDSNNVDNVSSTLNAITLEDCLYFIESILPYYQTDVNLQKNSKLYSINTVHAFAQLQSSVLHAGYLNALLNFPLPKCEIAHFYSGTLVYNLYTSLKKRVNVDAFIDQLIGPAHTVSSLYKAVSQSIHNLLKGISGLSGSGGKKPKKKRSKKRVQVTEIEVISEMLQSTDDESYADENNKFASLCVLGN